MSAALIFRQLFENESSTFTYILADSSTREAIIIDPVKETLERDLQIIEELNLNLLYCLETHVHADHITSAWQLREKTGCQLIAGAGTQLTTVDRLLADGETLDFGSQTLKALATPGHTDGCTSYVVGDRVFTGDALLIRGCGRTDFQQGSADVLFDSVRDKLFSLPEGTQVYPGHNYKGWMSSSIAEEKLHNPRLKMGNSREDFLKIMAELKLAQPKKIDIAVPANLQSGKQ